MLTVLTAQEYLAQLRAELTAFSACLAGDLDAPVAACGSWTLYDLADHLGGQNLWAAAAVTEQRKDLEPPAGPREAAALRAWFDGTADTLLAALTGDPEAPAWTLAPPRTRAFWQRRRAQETLVHRYDAELALGGTPELDRALALDGVAEVVDVMLPRQVRLARVTLPARTLRLLATDAGTDPGTDATWALGPGEVAAEVSGTAADLLLLLWGRLDVHAPGLACSGDLPLIDETLAGALVP